MILRYILDENGEPVKCPDLMRWGRWMEEIGNRGIARDDVPGGYVSTIFLGLDHQFQEGGLPILWETMVFGGPHNHDQLRYSSREAALQGHAEVVQRCRLEAN